MKRDNRGKPRGRAAEDAPGPTGQQTIEMLIDEIGAQSFPASDPPAWGTVTSRLARDDERPGTHELPTTAVTERSAYHDTE